MAQSVSNMSAVLKEVYTEEMVAFLNRPHDQLFREWVWRPRPDVVLSMRFWGAW